MLVELLANEEACVKAAIIEVFENMVDKFREKNVRHPDIVGAKSSPEQRKVHVPNVTGCLDIELQTLRDRKLGSRLP